MNTEQFVSIFSFVLPIGILFVILWNVKRIASRHDNVIKKNFALLEQLVELQKENNTLLRHLISGKDKADKSS